ncbi:tRNA-specific adenosine deaminase TAD3 [Cocos nucifera]|uniref:tRNA-specific adenosine deaminase TAD3 n=1 Tax=Cocos nucifera TaxID=13894 RepID=A0A8K0HUQ3_COCNU|nr:tRNA-specific adenosine deaminase TAD3 [Cocos nucifera]
MQWEIIHIPAKSSSSVERSTVDVLASNIEPKLANSLVSPDGITGFNEEESKYVFKYMKMAVHLAKSHYHGDKVVNAAVIVDPSCRQIIASACDQTCPMSTLTNETGSIDVSCIEREANTASTQSDADGVASSKECLFPNFSPDECSDVYSGVSCLNPWGWAEQRPYHQRSEHQCRNNYPWHPLRHAALVAIEKAAERDRQLFPSIGSSKNLSNSDDDLKSASDSSLAKRQKTLILKNEDSLINKVSANCLSPEAMQPYLCTGFDIYLVWEPCTMCAMALVHQRIRRIFYTFPNPNAGALGSVYRLQGEKSLNHHYSVFRILIPKKALYQVESNGSDACP